MTVLWARLANLGHKVSDQTVGNSLRRHDIAPAPQRSRTTTWKQFLQSHMDVYGRTCRLRLFYGGGAYLARAVTYYVLFFIEVGSCRVRLDGITRHPESWWMQQVARNATWEDCGYLDGCRYLLHDRDQKFCREFRDTLAVGGVKCLRLPARSPNLKDYVSHCTSLARFDASAANRWRLLSFPRSLCIFRGGRGPGWSYRHSPLSL
jgi:putative transposase